MKLSGYALLGASLLFTAGSARAAAVGTFTCNAANGQASAKVSYYNIGITESTPIGSQSSGAGAGKVTFNPLVLHMSLAKFTSFSALVGTDISACTLTTNLADGESVEYDFKLVAIQSINAIARTPKTTGDLPARYTDISLEYGALQVKTSGGDDDGGTDGGWNRITNSGSGGWNQTTNTQD